MDTARLWPCKGERQGAAFRRRIEFALASVARPLNLYDMAGVDQLLENTGKALLGDLQHVQELGDGQAGHSIDEMQDAVMRASETVVGQNLVRIGGKIPIGEEEQFDDRQIYPVIAGDGGFNGFGVGGAVIRHVIPVIAQNYVSTIDVI